MAKFQIFQYLFRPVMENQAGLPEEVFQAVNVQDSFTRKQELLGNLLEKNSNTARLSTKAIFM